MPIGRHRHFALRILLCAIAFASTARAEDGVVRATLDNGLRVIIVRNMLAPVVSTSLNYLVGSDESPSGFPGTAHAQEHMMFRGSPDLSADQLADIGSFLGGSFNANTREELTQYLYTVAAEDLDVALHIEATRMQGVLDTETGWDQERGAIEQEVARDISNPIYVLLTRVRENIFSGSPYAHDALGTRPSFDKTTAAMLKSFHDTWYAPNNAILIVVGALDPAATLDKVRELFGSIKPSRLPARPEIKLQPVRATSFTTDTDQPNGTLLLALRTPGLDSADFPALELLSDVLSSERFDLYGLVVQGKMLSAEFGLDPLQRSGMAYGFASFPAGGDPKSVENDIRTVLAKVKATGIPAELVEAAKRQEQRETELERNSIPGLASEWASAVALYGLKSPDEDLARIEKVTVADVNRVARKYLDLDHAVVAVAIPQSSGKPTASNSAFGGGENISLGEPKPTPLPDWAEAASRRLSIPPSTTNPIVSTLPNGLTLIVQPENVSDTVSIYGHIRNRPETEAAPGKEGVDQILRKLFSYGTETLDRIAFQKALDDAGATAAAGTDFSAEMLTKDFDRGTQLLADNELHPALPEDALQIIRAQEAQVVTARNRSPGYLAQKSLREALFPANDPSLRESTPESVRSLTMDDIKTYYRAVFRPDLATIVVVGKVSPESARKTIEKYFGAWTANGPKPNTDLPPAPDNSSSKVAVPDASRVQDDVTFAQTLTLRRTDQDYYPLEVGNALLGGSFYATRLSIDLRKNTGLVYGVNSALQAGRTRSAYLVNYACDPNNVGKAADIALQDIRKMQTTPVSAEELSRVKALLLRQIPLREASVQRIAGDFLGWRDLDLPLDEATIAARHYLGVTASDVQAALSKWLRPDQMVRVTQGPPPG